MPDTPAPEWVNSAIHRIREWVQIPEFKQRFQEQIRAWVNTQNEQQQNLQAWQRQQAERLEPYFKKAWANSVIHGFVRVRHLEPPVIGLTYSVAWCASMPPRPEPCPHGFVWFTRGNGLDLPPDLPPRALVPVTLADSIREGEPRVRSIWGEGSYKTFLRKEELALDEQYALLAAMVDRSCREDRISPWPSGAMTPSSCETWGQQIRYAGLVREEAFRFLDEFRMDGILCSVKKDLQKMGLLGTEAPAGEAPVVEQHVTLDQAAALVGRSKSTLRRLYDKGDLPEPDVAGGKGKAHEWKWSTLRPLLEEAFERPLPERVPTFSD